MKKIIQKAPVLFLFAVTYLLLTAIALGGSKTLYENQSCDFLRMPALTLVFQGMREEKYPWQIFKEKRGELQALSSSAAANIYLALPEREKVRLPLEAVLPFDGLQLTEEGVEPGAARSEDMPGQKEGEGEMAGSGNAAGAGKIQPFRKSTYEEYLNHISADIYGTAGVESANGYGFVPVEENYFDDALFIGDSRTLGLRDYTSLSEHGDFFCATSLNIYKVLEHKSGKTGTLEDFLREKEYGKIYLSTGINELGRGTTEDFIGKYQEVVDRLREMEPEAIIVLQAIMKVSREQNEKDAIFNNSNIEARNRAIATLADNTRVFYIDVNTAVCDEEGNLEESFTYDEIHLLGVYNEKVKQFLLEKGIPYNREENFQ